MRGKDYLLAFISLIFLVLSFPRFDFEFLAWVAFIPWFLAVEKKSAGEAGRFSFFLGLIYWLAVLFWLRLVTVLGLVLLAVYLSFYFSLWGLGIKFIQKRTNFSLTVISPVLWVALEWLRGNLFSGFPWLPLGNSQYLNLNLIQIAEYSGVYGLSFLVVMVNAALAEILIRIKKEGIGGLRSKWVSSLMVGMLVLFCFGYGRRILKEYKPERTLKAAVIQGNISKEVKWFSEHEDKNREVYLSLSEEAGVNRPDLIVWPETAITVSLPQDLNWRNSLNFLAESSSSFLLVGSLYYSEDEGDYFNSAFLISPRGESIGRYDKLHLVPFGEYIPKKDYFPRFFDEIFQQIGDYSKGSSQTIFKMPQGNFNVLICFEDIFPDLVRQFVGKGSELLVTITNDVWFGKSSAPFQHLAMDVFRAIENRRYVIRCANTGISAFINPQGKILSRVEDEEGNSLWIRGFLIERVGLEDKLTFYTRFGDWFVYLNLLGSGILMVLSLIVSQHKVTVEPDKK